MALAALTQMEEEVVVEDEEQKQTRPLESRASLLRLAASARAPSLR